MKKGKIFSINSSKKKGMVKLPIDQATLIKAFGLEGDAHGGPGLRQVSLLAVESIHAQKKELALKPGDYAENITTQGIDFSQLKLQDKMKIGEDVLLKLSKFGKECHKHCAIYNRSGDCIMPREGIFAEVIQGGSISVGDAIEVLENG